MPLRLQSLLRPSCAIMAIVAPACKSADDTITDFWPHLPGHRSSLCLNERRAGREPRTAEAKSVSGTE